MTLLHTNHLLHLCLSQGCTLFHLFIHQFFKFIIYTEWSTQLIDQEQWQNVVRGLYNMFTFLYSVPDAYVASTCIVHICSTFLSATAVPQILYVLIGHTIFICCYLAPLINHLILSVSISLAWLALPCLRSIGVNPIVLECRTQKLQKGRFHLNFRKTKS